MARQLVDTMSGPWTPSEYRDTYTDRVNELVEAKKNEQEFQPAADPPAATGVSDLTAALQASVDSAKKRRQKPAGSSKRGKASGASKTDAKSTPGKTGGKKVPAKAGTARRQRRKPAA
jgi:DNA end-binding protein Ku